MLSNTDPQYPYRYQDGSVMRQPPLDTIDEELLLQEAPVEEQLTRRGSSVTMLMESPAPDDVVTVADKQPKQTLFQRKKRCIIITGVLLLIGLIVLIVAVACFHQVAQMFMNGAQVNFESIKIQQPSQDSFQAAIRGGIRNAGPFNADTEPMNITILYEGSPLGWMMLPAVNLKMGSAVIDVVQEFTIINQTAFVDFSKHMLSDDQFTWQLLGNTNIKVMGLVSANDLVFDKKIQLAGMGNFPGVRVDHFNLQGQKVIAAQIGTALDNKSPISIEMGLLTMDMFFEGSYVGRVNTTLDALNNGLNPLNLSGGLVAPDSTDPGAVVKFSKMFSNYIQGVDSTITCIGVGLVSKEGTVGWLVESIRSLNMSVVLPGGKDLNLIKSLKVSGMELDFNTGKQNSFGITASSVQAGFQMPFDFPIEVLKSRQNIKVYNGDVHIASMNTDWTNSSNSRKYTVIDTFIPPSFLEMTNEQIPLFAQFLTELFVSESKQYTFVGTADLIAKTPVGTLTLVGAALNQSITSQGMQGLNAFKQDGRTSNPIIHNTTVHRGLSDQIIMSNWITLYSPSDVAVHMGDINLELQHTGLHTGYTILRNLSVYPGDNEVNVETYLQPLTDKAKIEGMVVCENFLNGVPTETFMVGTTANSTNITALAQSVSKLKLHAPFPGVQTKLVQSSLLHVNPLKVPITKKAVTSFKTVNPFEENFTLDAISGTIYQGTNLLAEMAVRLPSDQAIKVPGLSTVQTKDLEVTMNNPLSIKAIKALGKGLVHDLNVTAITHIEARLGDFKLSVGYNDTALPAVIKLTLH